MWITLVLLAVTSVTPTLTAADGGARVAPSEDPVVRRVVEALEGRHLRRWQLDDQLSEQILEQYVSDLDPQRSYLFASDVAEFAWAATELDDLLASGDISVAYDLYERLGKRVLEAIDHAESILDGDIDFERDERIAVNRSKSEFVADAAARNDLTRRRIKLQLLEAMAAGETLAEAKVSVAATWSELRRRTTQVKQAEVREIFLTALGHVYDPHTSYLSAATLEEFQIAMRLELEGIGAQLKSGNGLTFVDGLIAGGAASNDGTLQIGDAIVAVGQGHDGALVSIVNMRLLDVVGLIRGPKGSTVRLRVRRDDNSFEFSLTRAKVELAESAAKSRLEAGTSGRKFGFIELPSFYRGATADVARLIGELETQGAGAIVLDLRRNGGGALDEAIELTGLFIDRGAVVQVKSADGTRTQHDDLDSGSRWDGPLVVLTSRRSASASEIVAGAIRDYRRGLVIGAGSTYGKGTVQQLVRIEGGGALKVTSAQFYRVNGDSTQNLGVVPHIQLPSMEDHRVLGEAYMKRALSFDRIDPVEIDAYRQVSPVLVETLVVRSDKRRASNPVFDKIRQEITRHLEKKERVSVPLQQGQYTAEQKGVEPSGHEATVDRYLEEILSIVDDYVTLQ